MQKSVGITQMPRRAFLAWGSALAAGALGGKAFDAPALSDLASTNKPADVISVGYGAPFLATSSDLIEACSLSAGDSEFVRWGARVTIFGLEGMESTLTLDGIKSFALDVAYPGNGGAQPLLVHAWRFTKGPVAHVSPGNSFVVPVGRDSGLSLILETEDGAGVRKSSMCRFTVGAEPELPKLLRGIYAVAPYDAFAWRGLAWSLGDGSRPRLVRRTASGDELAGADFPCLAMTVEYSNGRAELRA
jgi:hypothetical protein